MAENKERPGIFVGWVHNGEKSFEVIPKTMYGDLLYKLMMEDGVHPGAIFISKMTMCNWVAPDYHKGCRQVWLGDFWDEINNIDSPAAYYEKPKYKVEKRQPETKYGWLAPDGRFFRCGYGGHSNLADKIVGDIEYVANPERLLEEKGWAKVLTGGSFNKTYAIGMGYDRKLTDAQLKELERMGTDDIYIGSWFL